MQIAQNSLLALTDRHIVGTVISTSAAAAALNRKSQTLRKWACFENGPIRPVRIHGRLGWRVADIEMLLQGALA